MPGRRKVITVCFAATTPAAAGDGCCVAVLEDAALPGQSYRVRRPRPDRRLSHLEPHLSRPFVLIYLRPY
jgi:hypothetical protein